jgi:hypothetical protein
MLPFSGLAVCSDIPETATLNQAAESIASEVAAVEAAQAQMNSGLNCP